jgi:hypothetical protein
MLGLHDGISDGAQKVIDAARSALEKTADEVAAQLDKIKGKASSFSDAIRSGFAGFADLTGGFTPNDEGILPNIADILQTQVGGAVTLAHVLDTLKLQGASKGLLQQVAGGGAEGLAFGQAALAGGPQQIDEINAALKTIAELSQQTGKALSEAFFGDRIDKVERKLDRLHDDLQELNQLERLGHGHDIVLNGEKVADATRRELIRTGSRNSDIFGGRA